VIASDALAHTLMGLYLSSASAMTTSEYIRTVKEQTSLEYAQLYRVLNTTAHVVNMEILDMSAPLAGPKELVRCLVSLMLFESE
jgi:hypothetical protein